MIRFVGKESFTGLLIRAISVVAWTIAEACAVPQASSDDTLPLQYQPTMIALGFSSPLLRATVRGQPVWFIVDTGASANTLASWLVSAAHLDPRQTTAVATGSTGAQSSVRAVVNEKIHLEGGRALNLRQAIVVELPPIFAEQKIGGLLSPQLLAPGHLASVLDLRVPTLRFESFEIAVAGLGRNRPLMSSGSRACRNAESPFENRQYAVPVTADGTSGTLLLDTGATSTLVAPGSRIAAVLRDRASESGRMQGVGGDAQMMRKAPNVRIERAGTTSMIAVTIGGSTPSCGSDGLIGMDALRQCILVLGESTFAWSCQAE
jgi:predicted aspartyl protease